MQAAVQDFAARVRSLRDADTGTLM